MEEKVNYQTEEERSTGRADHSSEKVPQGETHNYISSMSVST